MKAQKEIGAAKKGAINPFFKSKYADLGSVMEACKEKLNKQGIVVLQPIITNQNGVCVETILLHESGEYISGKMQIVCKEANNPQAQGSAITYARRYGLQSMVFIPGEDDDAEKATKRVGNPSSANKYNPTDVPAGSKDKKCELCGALGQFHKTDCPNKPRS